MRRIILTFATLLFAAASDAAQICVSASGNFDKPDACVAIENLKRVEVPVSDRPRLFLFMLDGRQDFIIGTQPAKKAAVDLHVGDSVIGLNLEGAKVRGWPVATQFELMNASHQSWRWTFSAEQVSHSIAIRVPDDEYTFTLTADGHEFLKKTVTMASRPHAENLTLRPTLRIAAHAVSVRPNEIVAFPIMTADCERKLCEGDVHGDIRCDVPRTAKTVCIEHPQYGRKRVIVDPNQTDVDLGNVVVAHTARVEVAASPNLELPAGTTVALLKKRREMARQPLEPRAVFDDVDPGDYRLLVAGPEPLQRKLIPLKLAENADEHITIEIAPYKLTGQVRYGDAALPNAKIELMERDWKAQLAADDHGRFSAEMWDAAEFATLVTGGVLTEPFGAMKRISESDSDWTIKIPDRAIRGTIRDASNGAPIAGAAINIESTGSETHFNRVVESDANGVYAIYGATDGDHALTVKAKEYCIIDPIVVHLGESDASRTVDFALMRGINLDVAVVDGAGAPVANAVVVDDVTSDGTHPRRLLLTERNGHVRVPLASGTQKMIYVLPRNGSLASALLAAPRGEAHEVKIVIPDGSSALRLRALLASGVPLPGLVPRIRLNGEPIPEAVLRLYAQSAGISMATDAAGEVVLPRLPAGMYELSLDKRGNEWTRVAVAGGETVIVQRFSSN